MLAQERMYLWISSTFHEFRTDERVPPWISYTLCLLIQIPYLKRPLSAYGNVCSIRQFTFAKPFKEKHNILTQKSALKFWLIAQKKTSSFSRNVTKQVKIVIIKDTGKSYTRSSYAAAIWGVLPLTLSLSSLGYTRWFHWILSLWCCWGTPHKLELGVFGCRMVSCSWTWLSALIGFLNPDV